MTAYSDAHAIDGRPHGSSVTPAGTRADVIGPNAITRLAQALTTHLGSPQCRRIFELAGVDSYLDKPPLQMVKASDVAALHRALVDSLGYRAAAGISLEAGRLTGDYLLAHRIPQKAQWLLRMLPRALAARILVRAIARHAWTFAGAGTFSYSFQSKLTLRLTNSPVCRNLRSDTPACHYFAGTFERVFGAMLGPRLRVIETECEAAGAQACVFSVSWR